jgi:hypothetical protein
MGTLVDHAQRELGYAKTREQAELIHYSPTFLGKMDAA